MNLERLIELVNIPDEHIANIYLAGSRYEKQLHNPGSSYQIGRKVFESPLSCRKSCEKLRNLKNVLFFRVFGTAQIDSDWDFVIVVDNAAASLLKDGHQEGEGRIEVAGLLDVTLYTEDSFRKLLNHHLPLMVCLSLPPEMIWREKIDFKIGFSLDLSALRTAVSKIASQGFGYAKICFERVRKCI
jgi:predicted nucleotidyltransferase